MAGKSGHNFYSWWSHFGLSVGKAFEMQLITVFLNDLTLAPAILLCILRRNPLFFSQKYVHNSRTAVNKWCIELCLCRNIKRLGVQETTVVRVLLWITEEYSGRLSITHLSVVLRSWKKVSKKSSLVDDSSESFFEEKKHFPTEKRFYLCRFLLYCDHFQAQTPFFPTNL